MKIFIPNLSELDNFQRLKIGTNRKTGFTTILKRTNGSKQIGTKTPEMLLIFTATLLTNSNYTSKNKNKYFNLSNY